MKNQVWLSIVSEAKTADEISAYAGIGCDSSWRPGDIRHPTSIVEKNHGWVLKSGLPAQGADISAHIEALLARVRPFANRIQSVSSEASVSVQIIIYSRGRFGFALEAWAVREITALGAEIDLDVYFIGGAEDELDDGSAEYR